jgi:hypothetical protein
MMTPEDVSTIAREATRETLRYLGLDVDNIQQTQSDFATLRRLRQMQERSATVFTLTFITLVVTGVAALIWERITQ